MSKPLWKQIVDIGRKATAKRLPTSRERKAQASVNLYRRLKERENTWHWKRALHVDPPLLNDKTVRDWAFERAMQLTKRILHRGRVNPGERRELAQLDERFIKPNLSLTP